MLEEKVISLVRESLSDPTLTVTLDSHLADELDVDSITSVMILRAIEDELSISLSEDFIPKIKTVRDIVEELERLGVTLKEAP